MAGQFLTVADVFDPVRAAQMQMAGQDHQQRRQINALALQEAQRQNAINNDPATQAMSRITSKLALLEQARKSGVGEYSLRSAAQSDPDLLAYFGQQVPMQGAVQPGGALPQSNVRTLPPTMFQEKIPNEKFAAKLWATQHPNDPRVAQVQEALKSEGKDPVNDLQAYEFIAKNKNSNDPAIQAQVAAYGEALKNKARDNVSQKVNIAVSTQDAKTENNKKSFALDTDTKQMLADQYLMTGHMPPLGMGSGAAYQRREIFDAAAKSMKDRGMGSWDIVANTAKVKADSNSLSKLQQLQQMSLSFENTANGLFDKVAALSAQLPKEWRGKIKTVNDLVMAVENQTIGDPIARDYYNTMYEAMVDYGKVVNGQFSMSGMTDTARKEAEKLLTMGDSPETIARLVGPGGSLRGNMKIRTESNAKQMESITSGFKDYKGASPSQPGFQPSQSGGGNPIKIGRFIVEVLP